MRLLNRITAPAATPVSLSELKAHLRIEHSADDTLLGALLATAVAEIDGRDGYLRRAIVTQTWETFYSRFPACRRIVLPMPPLRSVAFIKYYDGANVEQTFDAANYEVVNEGVDGYIMLQANASWPATYEREKAVTARFECGYGDAAATPANIKHAILLRCGELYHYRGDGEGSPALSPSVKSLLNPSRLVSV